MRTKAVGLACVALAEIAVAKAATAKGVKKVGSWTVVTSELVPGHVSTKLGVKTGRYSVTLECLDTRWRLTISATAPKRVTRTPQPVELTYSIDGAPPDLLRGEGQPSYKFGMENDANTFIKDVLAAKETLSIAIQPADDMDTTQVIDTDAAITPLLIQCPI